MASISSASTPPRECPVCGADVPRGARACPECGADERTGWDEEATRYDGLDLPDAAFDDADQPTRGGRQGSNGNVASGTTALWWGVAIVVLIAIGVGVVLRFG